MSLICPEACAHGVREMCEVRRGADRSVLAAFPRADTECSGVGFGSCGIAFPPLRTEGCSSRISLPGRRSMPVLGFAARRVPDAGRLGAGFCPCHDGGTNRAPPRQRRLRNRLSRRRPVHARTCALLLSTRVQRRRRWRRPGSAGQSRIGARRFFSIQPRRNRSVAGPRLSVHSGRAHC
jgi:hypothetical protein